MARSFEIKHHRRIVALIILLAIFFIFAAMRVFEFQIVNGEGYLNDTQKNSAATITISAARGEIVDRNGIPFTKNKAVFNVEFDYTFMKKGTENQIIHNLMKLFEKQNIKWIDELPITQTQPYEFIQGKENEIKRLKKALGVNEYATAEDCMEQIYRQTGIKKYEDNKGKCTHCGKKFDECDYEGYSEEMSRKLASVRAQMLQKEFSRYNTRYTFAEDVSPTMVALIREFSADLTGVEIVEKAVRTYVSGDVASHIIGSMGPIYAEEKSQYIKPNEDTGYTLSDIIGKSGIEKVMESELHGKNGTMQVIKNSKGDIIEIKETVAPVAGKTVQLTLDYKFQQEVQQILADYITNFNETNKKGKKTQSASIVVLDVKTGGVLASVSYPYYNISDYSKNYSELLKAEGNPLMNYALNGTYRPGSTFKPIVAAAGLTENKATPTSTTICTGKYQYWGTGPDVYQPTCLRIGHGYEPLNVTQALRFSCNIYFYDLGRVLGINKMNEYANYFGLATDTGIELKSTIGNLSSREFTQEYGGRWEEGNTVQAAIGQMDTAVTPLQMAVEASTIANRGTRYNVHLVDGILTNDGKTVISKKETSIASQFNLSDAAYNAISQGMVQASQGVGAPYQLSDLGYQVALKTGTPQVSTTKTNHAFIAFAPVDTPEIAISAMVDDGLASQQMLRKILLAYEKSKGIVRESEEPKTNTSSNATQSQSNTSSGETQSQPETISSQPIQRTEDEAVTSEEALTD